MVKTKAMEGKIQDGWRQDWPVAAWQCALGMQSGQVTCLSWQAGPTSPQLSIPGQEWAGGQAFVQNGW